MSLTCTQCRAQVGCGPEAPWKWPGRNLTCAECLQLPPVCNQTAKPLAIPLMRPLPAQPVIQPRAQPPLAAPGIPANATPVQAQLPDFQGWATDCADCGPGGIFGTARGTYGTDLPTLPGPIGYGVAMNGQGQVAATSQAGIFQTTILPVLEVVGTGLVAWKIFQWITKR